MQQPTRESIWEISFETLYEATYQEIASEWVGNWWQRVDITTAILVAATASTSAIAGWALWSRVEWRWLWAVFAGAASVASVVHGSLQVPNRVKEQEGYRKSFSQIRVGLETLRQKIKFGLDSNEAMAEHLKIREAFLKTIGDARPDIALTVQVRNRVQDMANDRLKENWRKQLQGESGSQITGGEHDVSITGTTTANSKK